MGWFSLFICFLLFIWLLGYIIFRIYAPKQSTRRKMMIASWSAPNEGNIHGVLEIDVTKTQAYIEKKRKEGQHITITHIVIRAIALGLQVAPSMNGRILWGKFFPHSQTDIGCLVNIEGGKDLANAKITNVDKRSYASISNTLHEKAQKLRQGKDEDFKKTTSSLKYLPVFILKPLVYWVGFLGGSLGLDIPLLGVKKFPFGSCLVTSVGMMGLDRAFVPFPPYGRIPLLAMIGAIIDKPIALDGEVVIRPILTITATLDHRFVDGAHAALLAKKVREVVSDPEAFDYIEDEIESKKEQ